MRHPLVCLMLLAGLAGPTTWAQSDSPQAPASFEQRYPRLLKNNIFSRNRRPYVARPERPQRPEEPPAPPEESFYVLRGVVREGNGLVAFIEDTRAGRIERLHPRDRVAAGQVDHFNLDAIEYIVPAEDPNAPPRVTPVALGQNLLGQSGTSTRSGRSYRPVSTESSDAPTPPGDEVNDILRQLMERRQRELGR